MIWERKYKYDKSSAAIDSTNRIDWSPRKGNLIAKFFFFSYILSRICTTIEIPNFEREEKEKKIEKEREKKKERRKSGRIEWKIGNDIAASVDTSDAL